MSCCVAQESSQLESDQQSSQLLSTRSQSGRIIFVRSTNIRTFDSTVTRHSAATLPRKGRVASVSPDTPRMKKLYTYLYPSHLCLSRVLTLSRILASDRRPLRRARSLRSWFLTRGPDPGEQDNSASFATRQDEQTEPTGHTLTVDLYRSLAVCLTRERRRSVVV